MSDFVHLHTHTQYSLLDGAIKIPALMEKVDRLGMPAVAMTDHDNMYGAVDFQKAARERGIRPIIGTEIATTGGEDFREAQSPESYHLTLLATSREGYFNLAKLSSAAWMEGFHERTETPRIDFDYLTDHKEGLICLSGDLGSRVNQAILQEDLDEARRVARRYRDAFGEGNYYLELMRNGFPESETCSESLIELGEELDIPLVATNDCHYLERDEARAQAILMCIQLSKTVELERLMEHGIDDLHVRSGEEMRELFSDVPQACDNTVEIAQRCCDEPIPLGEIFLPQYDVPADFVEEEDLEEAGEDELIHEYFVHKAYADLETRFEEFDEAGKDYDREEYRQRLQDEIDIIREMDYPGYFLIVADFIQWAKDQEIPVGPGRGSGAGSLVAYAMRITDVDPMPYDLLFERFLNPERVSMPDFDIDFCMNRRGEVIDYVTDKYGEDNVGQIITYGKMKARSVIRDVGRTLNFSYSETDRIANLIPEDPGTTLDDALAREPKLRNLIDRDDRVEALFDIAQSLENVNRQAGIHAAGVVISDDPVWESVPIKRGDDGEKVTQYAMEQVEEAGLVKFDFLGLKTLTVIDIAEQLVNDQRGPDEEQLDIEQISLEDEGIYELISSGETTGVFQLESEGFQGLLQRMRPETFEDVVAAVALYRPGPLGSGMVDDYIDRKHGRAEVEYPHPELEDVLEPTYGVMVYQEQVMQTAQIMAGYSLGEADLLRRAMGKKKEKVMAKQREQFIEGAVDRGIDEHKAEEVFDLMAQFASYGFNKSHSAAYAKIAVQTAYLKNYHPVEFMAALMTCDRDNNDKIVGFLNEAQEMGIEVLPPDVNESALNFTTTDGKIRFGLGAIKGVGAGVVESIVEAREEGGEFESLYDFCERVDLEEVTSATVEALVQSGAFDSIGPEGPSSFIGDIGRSRAQMFAAVDQAVERGKQAQHDREVGQNSLFGEMSEDQREDVLEETYPDVDGWPDRELLEFERELLGFYVTGHPLDSYDSALELFERRTLEEVTEGEGVSDGDEVTVAGVVTELSEQPINNGEGRMAFVSLEDRSGRAEVLAFTDAFETYEETWKGEEPVLLRGEIMEEGQGEAKTWKIRADEAEPLGEARCEEVGELWLQLGSDEVDDTELEELEHLLRRHAGSCRTRLSVSVSAEDGSGHAALALPESYYVEPSNELMRALDRLFGREKVTFRRGSERGP